MLKLLCKRVIKTQRVSHRRRPLDPLKHAFKMLTVIQQSFRFLVAPGRRQEVSGQLQHVASRQAEFTLTSHSESQLIRRAHTRARMSL